MSSTTTDREPSVAIVGAGAAGIAAALTLIGHGISDVTVLEAQGYIGGRVKAVTIDGRPADLGGQFIHGRVDNPLYDIVAKLGRIPDHRSVNSREEALFNTSQFFCMSSGEKIDMDEVKDLVDALEAIEIDSSDGTSTKNADAGTDMTTTMQEAVDKAYRDFLQEKGQQPDAKEREIYDAVVRWFCKYIQIDNASEDLRTLAQFSDYLVLEGDRFTDVEGGMAGVLTTMADQLPEGTVKLNTPVTHIHWDRQSPSSPRPVHVTCTDGLTKDVDHVIVTSSLGCLKATHQQMFQPPLPQAQQTALQHAGFGAAGKVFLLFEDAFWKSHTDVKSFDFLWLDSHNPVIKSGKCLKTTKNGKPWWYGLHSCETVFSHPKVLKFALTHEQLEICEHLSDQEVMEVTTDILRVFLPHLTIPDPVAVYRSHWLTNPYTRGSYSNPSHTFTFEDRKHFGVPLPSNNDPRLMFAGEAYSPHFFSTVHGALTSGEKTAGDLLTHLGVTPQHRLIDLVTP